jgi:hypothetical protein
MYSKIKSMMACDAWRGVWCGVACVRILGFRPHESYDYFTLVIISRYFSSYGPFIR